MRLPILAKEPHAAGFQLRLLAAILLVILALTTLAFYFAQWKITAQAEKGFQRNFQAALSTLHQLQELRHATLTERCRLLAEKPRIHAALEDNALDLLYPSARDELHDLMVGDDRAYNQSSLSAKFYRFLGPNGSVLHPNRDDEVGDLDPAIEAQLSLSSLPQIPQVGYIEYTDKSTQNLAEVIAVPIFSTETGDPISALVVGFKPTDLVRATPDSGITSGLWVNNRLYGGLQHDVPRIVAENIAKAVADGGTDQNNLKVSAKGVSYLVFYKRLNPRSAFPAGYEICLYSLTGAKVQVNRLRWQIGTTSFFLFLGGLVASHFVSSQFSAPVEKLALDSERNREQRRRAEDALISTSEQLKRSTRYSADASHQLKSPVTILRSGIEALLERDKFQPEVYEELSALLHQTRRLTGVIDDLLLLSRMDAGHLIISRESINLSRVIDQWLDDLNALPDSAEIKIEKAYPSELWIRGEERYTSLIVQNLLENARKYNRPAGEILVRARTHDHSIIVTIGNTGSSIPQDAQPHIFKRFHYSSSTSGHGLGLNVARDLTRLHGGDIHLVRSSDDWTEFELRFPTAS